MEDDKRSDMQRFLHEVLLKKAKLKNKCEKCGNELGKRLDILCPSCRAETSFDKEFNEFDKNKAKYFPICLICNKIMNKEDIELSKMFPKYNFCWECAEAGEIEKIKKNFKVSYAKPGIETQSIMVRSLNKDGAVEEVLKEIGGGYTFLAEEMKEEKEVNK